MIKLADRPVGEGGNGKIPFRNLIPLNEIIADIFGFGVASMAIRKEYEKLINAVGNEFKILLDADYQTLSRVTSLAIARASSAYAKGKSN